MWYPKLMHRNIEARQTLNLYAWMLKLLQQKDVDNSYPSYCLQAHSNLSLHTLSYKLYSLQSTLNWKKHLYHTLHLWFAQHMAMTATDHRSFCPMSKSHIQLRHCRGLSSPPQLHHLVIRRDARPGSWELFRHTRCVWKMSIMDEADCSLVQITDSLMSIWAM